MSEEDRFKSRVPPSERRPDLMGDPVPPPGWDPEWRKHPPPGPARRPLMPPIEHESRCARLLAAAARNDVRGLAEATTTEFDWHADELVQAAGIASRTGALDGLRWLLAHGVSAQATTEYCFNREISADVGSEPLMNFAAAGGSIAAAEVLLAAGAGVCGSDGSGRTALHAAACGGHVAMATWLISHGADVNALAMEGTPLAGAVSCGQVEMARVLVSAGAKPGLKHDWCASALEAAAGKPEMLHLLAGG